MTREIKEIEDSLKLCINMDSPSVVLPTSIIEKHFPSPRHSGYPQTPSYNLGDLEKWAKEKGWLVKFASTGTKTDRRLVSGIRFIPLSKLNTVPNSTQNPASSTPDQIHDPWQKPLGKIAIGVIIGVLVLFVGYLIKVHFGIFLQ